MEIHRVLKNHSVILLYLLPTIKTNSEASMVCSESTGLETGSLPFYLSSMLCVFMTWGKSPLLWVSDLSFVDCWSLSTIKCSTCIYIYISMGFEKHKSGVISALFPQWKTRQRPYTTPLASDMSHEIIWPMKKIRRYSNHIFETSPLF